MQVQTNHTFEQREVLLNNMNPCIDAENYKYQNMQNIYVIKALHSKMYELEYHKDL